MRESYIERKVTEDAEGKGWLSRKWSSPGRRNVPDRIYFKAGELKIIEFKATDEEPRKAQLKEHERLRKQGFHVHVIDNIEDGKRLFA